MPSRDASGKRLSGSKQRARAASQADQLKEAKGLPKDLRELLGKPPAEDLELQLWAARCCATLAWVVLTRPKAISREQLSQTQRYLATLGMLFPRSEVLAKLKKLTEGQKRQREEKEVGPLGGLAPGPASRRRSAGGGPRPG